MSIEITQSNSATLDTFIQECVKNREYELEVKFGKREQTIDHTLFQKTMNAVQKSVGSEWNEEYRLDIIDKTDNNRLSIKGLESISTFCKRSKLYQTSDNLLKGLNIESLRKERVQINRNGSEVVDTLRPLDIPDYNIRIGLSNERYLAKADFKSDTIKTFRLKKIYSISTLDNKWRFDFSVTKQGEGIELVDSNVLNSVEFFEIETEYTGNKLFATNQIISVNDSVLMIDKSIGIVQGTVKSIEDDEVYVNLDDFDSVLPFKKDVLYVIPTNLDKIKKDLIQHTGFILRVFQDSPGLITNQEKKIVLTEFSELVNSSNRKGSWSIVNQPETLHMEHLSEKNKNNILKGYSVTDKADGERNLCYISSSGRVYLINNRMDIKYTGLQFKDKSLADFPNTLIDGEYISERRLFMAFDILFYKNNDVRNRILQRGLSDESLESASSESRLELLDKIIDNIPKDTIFTILKKTFLFGNGELLFKKNSELWNKDNQHVDGTMWDSTSKFKLDGLIFTPVNEIYTLSPGSLPVYKWKPPSMNSIDFLVELEKKDGDFVPYPQGDNVYYKAFLKVGKRIFNKVTKSKEYKPVLFFPEYIGDKTSTKDVGTTYLKVSDKKIICKDNSQIFNQSIVEFSYERLVDGGSKMTQWVPLRVREDKTALFQKGEPQYGNNWFVANDIWNSIHNPVTEEMITTGKNIQLGYYDKQVKGDERMPYQDFHTKYIKRSLIYNFSKDKLLDLAVGQAGDLWSWNTAKIKEVVGIDKDKKNITAQGGARDRYSKFHSRRNTPECTFLQGDSGHLLNNGSAAFLQSDKDALKQTFKDSPYFDTASIQFAIHYLFEKEESLRGFLDNVARNLKTGGYLIGTTWDGDEIFKKLKKMKKNQTYGNSVFSVTKKYDIKKFEKKNPYNHSIDVKIENIGQTHTEYLVNFQHLKEICEEYGLKCVELKSFADHFKTLDTYLKNKVDLNGKHDFINPEEKQLAQYRNILKMNEDEKDFSFMYKTFVFQKINDYQPIDIVVSNDDDLTASEDEDEELGEKNDSLTDSENDTNRPPSPTFAPDAEPHSPEGSYQDSVNTSSSSKHSKFSPHSPSNSYEESVNSESNNDTSAAKFGPGDRVKIVKDYTFYKGIKSMNLTGLILESFKDITGYSYNVLIDINVNKDNLPESMLEENEIEIDNINIESAKQEFNIGNRVKLINNAHLKLVVDNEDSKVTKYGKIESLYKQLFGYNYYVVSELSTSSNKYIISAANLMKVQDDKLDKDDFTKKHIKEITSDVESLDEFKARPRGKAGAIRKQKIKDEIESRMEKLWNNYLEE